MLSLAFPLTVKFVHAADLHLDSPLRGLERYEHAPTEEIRGATRRAFERLVQLCVEEAVDFLLLAGDLYDGDHRDYSTGLFLAAQMSVLRESGVKVFVIRGNHDAASQITSTLTLPDNVVSLDTARPQTVIDHELGIAVHGQGFATRAVTEDLAAAYPDRAPDLFNIGLLHTALTGRPGHDTYAPTSVDVLASKGYDYWALGHVHAFEVVAEDPWIVFPGNLQGRSIRETGPKGAVLVSVEDDDVAIEHHALDVVRWAKLEVDATGCRDADDAFEAIREALQQAVEAADNRLLAARVTIVGATGAHAELIEDVARSTDQVRAVAFDFGVDAAWVEKVRFETRPLFDVEALIQRDDPLGRLFGALAELREGDDDALRDLGAELKDLRLKLPTEAQDGEDGVRPDRPDYLRGILKEVESLLLPRLLATGQEHGGSVSGGSVSGGSVSGGSVSGGSANDDRVSRPRGVSPSAGEPSAVKPRRRAEGKDAR